MAKIRPTPETPIGRVVDGWQYIQNPSGAVKAQASNQNRSKPTNSGMHGNAGFQTIDQNISALDAQFEMLSNRDEWDELALEMDGQWNLCADCIVSHTGKKLFRQINMNRIILGLGQITSPPDNPGLFTIGATNIGYGYTSTGETTSAVVSPGYAGQLLWLQPMNLGAWIGPRFLITADAIGIQTPARGDIAAFVIGMMSYMHATGPDSSEWVGIACVCDLNGVPGARIALTVDTGHT